MPDTLLLLALTLVILCACLISLVRSNQNLLKAERRRSAERAQVDRGLIDALQANVEAQKRRADVAEYLAQMRKDTIDTLSERLGFLHDGKRPIA